MLKKEIGRNLLVQNIKRIHYCSKWIFDEVRQEDIPEAQPNMQPGTFFAGNKSEDVRMRGGWIKEALID